MGCSLSEPGDKGPLVSVREVMAHKLPGTDGSRPSTPDFQVRKEGNISPVEARQYHSEGLCQQPGRNRLKGPIPPLQGLVGVGPGEEYPHHSPTFARGVELEGQHRVPDDEGLVRLEVGPNNIPSY